MCDRESVLPVTMEVVPTRTSNDFASPTVAELLTLLTFVCRTQRIRDLEVAKEASAHDGLIIWQAMYDAAPCKVEIVR